MKNSIKLFLTITLFCGFFLTAICHSEELDSQLSMNVVDSPLKGVLEMIALKSGMTLVMDDDPKINVSIAQSGVTARQLLEKISSDQQIEYMVSGNQLIVTKRKGASASMGVNGEPKDIILHYASASELLPKLTTVIGSDGKLLVDEHQNRLIFVGSARTLEKVKNVVALFDTPPKQIMIEALIVETTHQFLQDIGISVSGIGDGITTPGPTTPNISFKGVIGNVSSRALDIKLTAAESKGDAKVLSRPKVTTLNNRQAKVESGTTYTVKTLSNVPVQGTKDATTPGILTGGLSSVEAGLSLTILPTLVGEGQIKMIVDVNDSTPDASGAVDGIPGILKNSANTAVIVGNKQTAVIAGLIKQSHSKNHSGVPILMDIPLIGALFRSSSVNDSNNELVIFLTPTIDEALSPEDRKIATAKEISAAMDGTATSKVEGAKKMSQEIEKASEP